MKSKSNDKVCLNDNKSYVSKIALIVIIGLASFNLYYNNVLINRSAFLFRDIKTDNKYGKFLLLHNSSINANFNVDKNIDIDDINIELGNFILVSHLINGYQNQAVKIANQLIEKKKIDTYAVSVLMFDYIRNKDWDKLISFIDSVKINKKNEQILILIKAWALVAKNDLKAGLKQLEQIKKFKGFEDIYFTHKAMMYEFSEDNLNAIEAYKESLDLKVSLRTVELLSKLYIRMDRVKSAIDTIDHYIATRPDSEMAKLFRAWLDNKNNIKNVKNNKMQITEGFAEAFFNLGFYNQLKKVDNLSLLFTCLSISVNPNLDFAKLTLANLLANGGKREDAIRIANMIDKNSYFHWYPDTEGNKSNGWVVTKAANQSCRVVVGEKGYDMEIGMYYRPDGVYTPTFFDGTNSSSTTISRNYTSKLDTALYRPYVRNASTVEMTVESGSRFIFV